MSLSSFVVFRSWASSPLRTALTVLGIAAGTAIVVAISVMDHNTIQTRLRQQVQAGGAVDLTVVPRAVQPVVDVVADLRGRPGVRGVGVWRQARAELSSPGGAPGPGCPVEVFGIEGSVVSHYAVAQGRDLAPDEGERAVLLGAEAARQLGVQPGATIDVREPALGTRYECRGGQLVALPRDEAHVPFTTQVAVAGILAPELLGRHGGGLVLVGARSLAAKLAPAAPDEFQLQRGLGADIDALRHDLRRDYAVSGATLGEAPDERAFRNGLKVIGCLALVLGMFVVFQTLSHSLVARVRLLGLLRCLGASRGIVTRIFLGDALLLGVLGSVLGLALGVGLAWLLKAREISSLGGNKPWAAFELPLGPMLWTAGLGVIFTLAGAAFPLWRARRMPALWILRQRAQGEGREGDLLAGVNLWLFAMLLVVLPLAYLAMTPLLAADSQETLVVLLQMAGMTAAVGGLLLIAPVSLAFASRALLVPLCWVLPLPAWLCRKTIERQAGRVASGVVGLAAVLLAFLGLKSLTSSLVGDAQTFGGAALDGRAFVQFPERTAAALGGWAQLPGVAAVEAIEGEVSVGAGPGPGFALRGLAPAALALPRGALDADAALLARYADRRDRTLVASRRLALQQGWQPGTPVPLRDRNGARVFYEVLVVSDASGYVPMETAWAVTAPHWLRTDFCVGESCVQFATLRLAAGADYDAVNHALRERAPDLLRYKSGPFLLGYLLADVDRDFYIFDLLLLLILGLAATGLLNGMTIAALGRAREIGVLQALGVGQGSLRSAMLLEGLVVGGLASLLALLLAAPMAWILVSGLNRVASLAIPVVLPRPWLFALPPIALVTGVLAALLPAIRGARTDPAAAVRCE